MYKTLIWSDPTQNENWDGNMHRTRYKGVFRPENRCSTIPTPDDQSDWNRVDLCISYDHVTSWTRRFGVIRSRTEEKKMGSLCMGWQGESSTFNPFWSRWVIHQPYGPKLFIPGVIHEYLIPILYFIHSEVVVRLSYSVMNMGMTRGFPFFAGADREKTSPTFPPIWGMIERVNCNLSWWRGVVFFFFVLVCALLFPFGS